MPGQGSRASIALALAVAAGLMLRIAPLAYTWMPLDCDSWYIHYDIQALRRDPSSPLLSSTMYDGYNNYWPASILTPYTLSMTLGAESLSATHLTGPLLDGLSLIPLYALARRLTSPARAAYATIIVGGSASMIGLGVGLVKETVARPLLYTVILSALAGSLPLTLASSLGLALTHHLTSTIAAVVLAATPVYAGLLRAGGGVGAVGARLLESMIPAAVTIAYLLTVPPAWWRGTLTVFDPVQLALYLLSFTMLAALGVSLIGEKPGFASKVLPTIVIFSLVVVVAVHGLSPGVQAMGASASYYTAPVLLAPPLVAGAFSRLRHRPWIRQSALPYAWSFTLAGVVAYLSLSQPLGQSPAGRVANLMLPGLALLYAYGGKRMLAATAVIVLALSPLYLASLLGSGDPETFDLPYHRYEYTTVKLAATSPLQVYGDSKMRDISYYLGVETRNPAYTRVQDGILLAYRENLVYGYKLDSNLHTGRPEEITTHLTSWDRLTDTGESWILMPPSSG